MNRLSYFCIFIKYTLFSRESITIGGRDRPKIWIPRAVPERENLIIFETPSNFRLLQQAMDRNR